MNPQELKQLEDDLWRSADTLRANSDFIKRHRHELANGNGDLFVYGQEKTLETVKLATLWFFDRAKKDEKILFIDARNIFTQIDRAHREFSDEQVLNIAIISHLHKGKHQKFIQLIERYFEQDMEKLPESNALVEPISKQLLLILAGNGDKQAAANLVKQWSGLKQLQTRYGQYLKKNGTQTTIAKKNKAQHILRQHFDPFFDELHQGLKQLEKIIHHHVLKLTEEK